MTLNISDVVYKRVLNKIKSTPNFVFFIEDFFPNFREQFTNKSFGIIELEEINDQINNFSSSRYQNLIIAIRLSGGCIELSRICRVDSSYIIAVLKSRSDELHGELSRLMVKYNLVSDDFFNQQRIYFPRKFIDRFRKSNISKLFLTANDFQEMYAVIEKTLRPGAGVLPLIQKGVADHRSCWACRRIERELGLSRGFLDEATN